jgi:hypothetical protein
MSFFKRAKEKVKKVVSNFLAPFKGKQSQAAAGALDFSKQSKNTVSISEARKNEAPVATGQYGSTTYYGNSFPTLPDGKAGPVQGFSKGGGSVSSSGGFIGPTLPKTITGGQQKAGGGGNSGGGGSWTSEFSPSAFTAPITTSSLRSASTTQTGAVQGGGGGGYNTGGTVSNSPISVPTYKQTDPGNVDTTGLAGSMAGYYTRKDDGTFEPVTQDPFGEKSDADIIKEKARLYKEAFGQPQDVYQDREVRRAQEARRQAQEALLAPTAQLNAVLGQAQRDTLQLRQTAQKEGVVEAVYGQQAAAINYNAAIAALPLQSNIAALQGNLELADSYLNELVTMKKEQIRTQYEYNKGLFDTIYSALDAKEKRVADRLVKENDRQYKSENELVDYKAQLIAQINSQGDPNAHVRVAAVERAKDKVTAARAAGDLRDVPRATAGGQYTTQQGKSIDEINNAVNNSIKYKAVSNAQMFAEGVLTSLNQGNGLGDVAAINQFQKVIDEGAVTREQDVKLVQGAQSFANTLKTKIKKLEKGDQLGEDQRQNMRTLVEQLYEAKVNALGSDPYIKSQIIKADRNGLNLEDTILGQLGSFGGTSTSAPSEGETKTWEGKTYKKIGDNWVQQ